MKIALIGYGKMGHAIERIALERGHEIVARIDADNIDDMDSPQFAAADVAIEFTFPTSAADNCLRALKNGVKVVSGTTAWQDKLPAVKELCDRGEGTFMWSSNYSIGVNLFLAVNSYLARFMAALPQYSPSMNEVHHVHKLDHPSGTAITLAETIMKADPAITGWTESETVTPGKLPITHERRGEVPGIHTVEWDSPVDTITLTHSAKNRDGFALGAVMAAEWLSNRQGWHTIDEMIDDILHGK